MIIQITEKGKRIFDKKDKYDKINILKILLNLPDTFNNYEYQGEKKINLREIKQFLIKDKFDEMLYSIKEELDVNIQNNLIYPCVYKKEINSFNIVDSFIEDVKKNSGIETVFNQENGLRSDIYYFEKNLRNYSDFYGEKEKTIKTVKNIFEERIGKIEKDIKIYQEDVEYFKNSVDEKISGFLSDNFSKFIEFNYGKIDKVLISFIVGLFIDNFINSFYQEYDNFFSDFNTDDVFFEEVIYINEDVKQDIKTLNIENLIF